MSNPPEPLEPIRERRSRRHSGSRQKLWFGLAAILALSAVAAVLAAQSWLEAYLRSDAFRLQLQNRLGQIVHGEIELKPLRRSGTSLSSEALSARGQSGASFRSLELHELRADLDPGGLWKRVWRLEQLTIRSLEADLSAPNLQDSPSSVPTAANPPAPWWKRWLPSRGEIGTLRAEHSVLRKGQLEARNLRLTATPLASDWDVSAENGDLHAPSLPLLNVSSARAVLRPGAFILRQAHLLGPNGSQASVSGQSNRTAGSNFQIHFENLPSDTVLYSWWKAHLKGLLSGDLKLQKGPQEADPTLLTGTVQLASGRLETLPLLESLDRFLGSPRFQSVALKKASAEVEFSASKKVFRNLELDGDGLFRIQGQITLEGERIEGQLQLGLSPALIQWLPGARTVLFKEQRDGYVWTAFQVSGSLASPSEDLSARLLAAAKDATVETVKSLLPPVPLPLPPTLPTPGTLPKTLDAAKEAVKGVLDSVKSVLPEK